MVKVKSKLKDAIKRKGWDQKTLAMKAGVREATISEMCRDTNKMFPREVMNKIANALEIDDIREIIDLEDE